MVSLFSALWFSENQVIFPDIYDSLASVTTAFAHARHAVFSFLPDTAHPA